MMVIPIPNQGAFFVGSSFCSSTYETVRLRRLNPRRLDFILDFILDLKSVLSVYRAAPSVSMPPLPASAALADRHCYATVL
jgi:hypothetical protein